MSLPEQLDLPYQLKRVVGGHGGCLTYEAIVPDSGAEVMIKLLDFSHLQSWKHYELFEREAQTLAYLDHPGIPQVLGYARLEGEHQYRCYLALEKKPGQSLEQKLDSGWRASEAEAIAIAQQILEILSYLHQRHPPVIHRDLKPSNMIMDKTGKVYLIDFGALQQTLEPEGGSTVVGTFGYMPPEQFAGQVVPASDLYSLGVTLVHLLSGVSPSDMPLGPDLCLRFEDYIEVSPDFQQWLQALTTAEFSQRLSDSALALARLLDVQTRVQREASLMAPRPQRLQSERYQMDQTTDQLTVFQPNLSQVRKAYRAPLIIYILRTIAAIVLYALVSPLLPETWLVLLFFCVFGVIVYPLSKVYKFYFHQPHNLLRLQLNPATIELEHIRIWGTRNRRIPLSKVVNISREDVGLETGLVLSTKKHSYLLFKAPAEELMALEQELLNFLLRQRAK